MIKQILNRSFVLFLLTLLFFLANLTFIFAQRKIETDNKIKEGTLLMYKNPDEAIRIGHEIIKESKDNVDYKIKAYKLISDAYSSKRDYQNSLENVIKASQLLSFSEDDLLKIIITNKLGIQYHQLKIYDKSIQYLDQAEQFMLDYPVKDSILYYLGTNYIVRGFIYKEKLNCDIAIEYFDRGVNSLLVSKSKLANSGISIAKYNKGNCYLQLSNYPKAKENFQLAIAYATKVNANSLKAFALKGIAQVFTLEGKYSEAILSLKESLTISKNVNDLILNQEIYKGLSENYLALNKWEEYKEYHLKYLSTQKLIKERERKSISDSLDEKKSELDAKLDKIVSNFYIIYLIVFILIMVAVFIVLYRVKMTKKQIENQQIKIDLLQNPKKV